MKSLSLKFAIIGFLVFLSSCGGRESSEIPVTTDSGKIILALGDSLTAGLDLPDKDNYPSQLETRLRELGYMYIIQNAGVSGDTSAGLLSRIDWILEGDTPALAILCIGANDAFQGKAPEDIEKNIRTIIEKLQAKNIPILFAGMKAPFNLGGEYGRKYEAIFPKLAKEYDLAYMDFFLQGVALKAQYNQDDRIHPNREGYAIVVENLKKILEEKKLVKK